jgi:hypothetical protein
MDDPMIIDSSPGGDGNDTTSVITRLDTSTPVDINKENHTTTMVESTDKPSSINKKDTTTKDVASSTSAYSIPWVEKFRPRTLDDVLGNQETIIRLRAIAKDGNIPNLILCGPPGTGTYYFECYF